MPGAPASRCRAPRSGPAFARPGAIGSSTPPTTSRASNDPAAARQVPDPRHRDGRPSALHACRCAALTWTWIATGVKVATKVLFTTYTCPAPTRSAKIRMQAVAQGVVAFQIDEGRCPPTKNDLIAAKYVSVIDFVDPWG